MGRRVQRTSWDVATVMYKCLLEVIWRGLCFVFCYAGLVFCLGNSAAPVLSAVVVQLPPSTRVVSSSIFNNFCLCKLHVAACAPCMEGQPPED